MIGVGFGFALGRQRLAAAYRCRSLCSAGELSLSTPISEVASYMLVLVLHPSVPAFTLGDFVDFARSQPGGLTVANAGSGTPPRLAAVLVAQATGRHFVHMSYRGAGPAANDVLAGHVLAMTLDSTC